MVTTFLPFLFPVLLLAAASGCQHPKEQAPAPPAAPEHQTQAGAGAPAVIYLSKDTGKTWLPFADGLPEEATVSCFFTKNDRLFATTEFHGVYRRKGNTRQPVNTGLPREVHLKAIEEVDDVLVLGTSRHGVFTSADEGATWEQVTGELNAIPVRCLLAVNGKVFAGTDKGIYVSTDKGESWTHVFGTVQVTGFTRLDDKLYAGVMNGALLSTDEGSAWRYIYRPRTLHDIGNDGKFVYAMTLGEGLLKSADDGSHWENANEGLGTLNLYTFEVKQVGADLFAAQWIGIYHSTNQGRTWTFLEGGLPDSTAFTTLEVGDVGILAGIGLRK